MPSLNLPPTQSLLTKNPKSPIFYEDAFAMIRYILEIGGTGTGDVVGTPPSTDNAIARYDGATGLLIQNSLATISDAGVINIPAGQTYNINGVPIGGGDIMSDGSVNFVAAENWDNGGNDKAQVTMNQIRSYNNVTQFESTLNPDGTVKATDNGNSTYTKLNPDGSISLAYGASGASVLGFKKIHLTSAQIQTGNSVPIVLVAAAGAGTAIYAWHDTTARCVNGVVPAGAIYMNIQSASTGKAQIQFNGIFMTSATLNPIKGDDTLAVGFDDVVIANDDLIVVFDADNPLYDGTIDIYLKYEIITL
jgi:hypothetical protein